MSRRLYFCFPDSGPVMIFSVSGMKRILARRPVYTVIADEKGNTYCICRKARKNVLVADGRRIDLADYMRLCMHSKLY